jgi:phage tail tape-measure protein
MKSIASVSMTFVSALYGGCLYGQNVEQDDGKTHQELQVLANSRLTSLADSSDEIHRAQAKQLSFGKDFERSYAVGATSRLIPATSRRAPLERNYPSCRE